MCKPLVHVVAAIITNRENKTLVTKRPDGQHLGGYWEFPGGRIEDGEPPETALIREIREELVVDIEVQKLLWRDQFEYDIKTIDIAFYLCRMLDEKQKIICREIADFRWIAKEEFKELTFPPADKEMIRIMTDTF